jgi:hypothetical protein
MACTEVNGMLHAPNLAFNGIPLHVILSLVGIELAHNLFHGSVIVTHIIASEPANLE